MSAFRRTVKGRTGWEGQDAQVEDRPRGGRVSGRGAAGLPLADGQQLRIVKLPSTPPEFERAVVEAVGAVAGDEPASIVHGSTVVTSQLPVDHWHEVIADPTVADAVLDRLVHGAHRLTLKGESLRKGAAKRATLDKEAAE